MQTSELSKIYDTLLSIPGMNEQVKITLKMSRKNILLLSQIIETGTGKEGKETGGLLGIADKETLAGIQDIANDILEKSGLKDMKEKLSALHMK